MRNAFLDLTAATSQVEVARQNLDVTRQTLDLTRQRLEAGVTDTVDVAQAQASVAAAELDYINSVFAHNVCQTQSRPGRRSGAVGKPPPISEATVMPAVSAARRPWKFRSAGCARMLKEALMINRTIVLALAGLFGAALYAADKPVTVRPERRRWQGRSGNREDFRQ